MRYLKAQSICKIIIGIIFVTFLQINSFSYWFGNETKEGYGGGGDSTTESGAKTIIGILIVDGAGYFLDSYDKTLVFMKKTELMDKQPVSNDELTNLLDTALEQMHLANDTYVNLKMVADNTPYNPFVISALKRFNYDEFQEENALNKEIFSEVKAYLSKGDIRGVYGKILSDTGKIIQLLNLVKEKTDAGVIPPLNEVWKLNQAYSQTLLFGQYVSQVFYSL